MPSRTFELTPEAVQMLKELTELYGLTQAQIVNRAIVQQSIVSRNIGRDYQLHVMPRTDGKQGVEHVKEDMIVILETLFPEFGSKGRSLFAEFEVIDMSPDGQTGAARFIRLRPSERYKTFGDFSQYVGAEVEFQVSDVYDAASREDAQLYSLDGFRY